MKNLRRRFERFCLKNRSRGIPNLMFVLAIANVIVYVLTMIDPSRVVYSWLRFQPTLILQGQVWRLFTYLLTYLCDTAGSGLLLGVVSLYCYTQFGKLLEQQWGTCRFNLYYFCGVLLCDIAALVLGMPLSSGSLNLSLFLAIATLIPEARVLLFFIIPIKMKYMAWVYLGITALELITTITHFGFGSMLWLVSIVPLLNYFVFFGSDVLNLLPAVRYRPRPKPAAPKQKPSADWAASYQSKSGERAYRHKCTVCGRTDTEYPALEFRYCSRCSGYHCYCMDHINNHTHIE